MRIIFIYTISLFFILNSAVTHVCAQNKQQFNIISDVQDPILLNELIQWWKLQPNSNSSKFMEQIPFVAKYLLNTPYVEKTLEIGEKESLVINLREMDCVTYVENVLAITSILNKRSSYWNEFINSLVKIRYRDGIIGDYSSRLHYTTEWLQQKVENGTIILVSDYVGDNEMDTGVSFMTSNSHLYERLKNNADLINKMRDIEQHISSYRMNYVRKENIESVESFIQEGDIIAFVTSIKGLDISHIGFATLIDGRVYLLHASPVTQQVSITKEPLSDYMDDKKSVLGIVVGRVQ